MSLVFFKYSDHLGFSGNPVNGDICSTNAIVWEDIPRSIEFESNLEVIMLGQVSYGQVTIVPIEDQSSGAVVSDVRVYPESLQENISHKVESNDGITRLTLQMPERIDYGKECITANLEIRLPISADLLRLDIKNLDVNVLHPFVKELKTLDIKTSNSIIELGQWTGDSIKLVTSNGDLNVGALNSRGSIYLKTTNGDMSLSGNVVATRTATLKNSGGKIESFTYIKSKEDVVDIDTRNGLIQLSQVKANYVSLKNSNQEINVQRIDAKDGVLAKSSNGHVSLTISGAKNNQVNIGTSNAKIDLHMVRRNNNYL